MSKVKTAFFGSSKYSLAYLEFIRQNELLDLSLVVTQPDKPFGRGLSLQPNPVKIWSKEHKILCLSPTALTEGLFLGALATLPLSLGFSAYYGLKIPAEVIQHFPQGILNIHHSLLPKHRGPNPIPWSILAGEAKTGTTIIKINERIDQGLILAQAEEEIKNDDTTETLRNQLDLAALKLLEAKLPTYLKGDAILRPQEKVGSYEPKISREMAQIDWQQSDDVVERKIRAFSPWPGAWSTLDEIRRYKEIKTERVKDGNRRVKILKGHLDESQRLAIDLLQIEGKKTISWKEFAAGYLTVD